MTQRAIPDDFDAALTELCEAARFYGGQESGYLLSNTTLREAEDAARKCYDLLAAFKAKFNSTGNE